MRKSVIRLCPAKVIAVVGENIRSCGFQGITEPSLQFFPYPGQTEFLNGVFETGVFTALAVAIIPLNGDDGFRDIDPAGTELAFSPKTLQSAFPSRGGRFFAFRRWEGPQNKTGPTRGLALRIRF